MISSMVVHDLLVLLLAFVLLVVVTEQPAVVVAWTTTTTTTLTLTRSSSSSSTERSTTRSRSTYLNLTPLPKDIAPFDKSASKGRDIQGEIRKLATTAFEKALVLDGTTNTSNNNNPLLFELEFPPLLGGEKSKSQFDDFDNVQELNQNRDWCVEWLPTLAQHTQSSSSSGSDVWFILPDTKEVELAKEEWKGGLYRKSAKFTSIEAVAEHYFSTNSDATDAGYSKPWGASIANAVNAIVKGGGNNDNTDGDDDNNNKSLSSSSSTGLLGDESSLDSLIANNSNNGKNDAAGAFLHLVCQPGNGGPVEDWINVKKFHEQCNTNNAGVVPMIIVNGALDKVRDGYYAPFIFPKLAKTFDFYKSFQPLLYLKPISDKGLYGWLFKVYDEPWQVVLQRPTTVIDPKTETTTITVEDIVALVSDTADEKKPSYQECIQALVSCNANANAK